MAYKYIIRHKKSKKDLKYLHNHENVWYNWVMENAMIEHHKPAYHILPPRGWMNDPNGPLWYQGYYHLFYQHNPGADYWGNIHWGHIRSKDLVTWEHLPIALTPSPELRERHCFSGCAVIDDGTPAILYTSIGEGDRNARTGAEQYLAYSEDHLETWQKRPRPVLTNAVHEEPVLEWRDPFIWRENGVWNLLLGGSRGGYGSIQLYRSRNLLDWRFVNTFFETRDYPVLECPNLLRFGSKSVLFYSPYSEVRYHTGFINDRGQFINEASGILDYSGRCGFYAPNTLLNDPKGRYITWGWITEANRNGYPISGYNGALSLPRILDLDGGGVLTQTPADEVNLLFSAPVEQAEFSLAGGERKFTTRGRELEIELTCTPRAGDDFSLNLYRSPDGRECTRIRYNEDRRELTLEKGLSTLAGEPAKDFQRGNIPGSGGRLSLRVFLDHSIIEIFANHRVLISGRVYPVLEESQGLSLSGRAGQVAVQIRRLAAAKQ
jgi:beta-fructofuranosidase